MVDLILGSATIATLVYPLINIQTHLQLNSSQAFNVRSIFKGGLNNIISKLFLPILYPFERNQILLVANHPSASKVYNIGAIFKNGFTGYIGGLGRYAASLYILTSGTIPGAICLAGLIPLDTIRRNFVVLNAETKISYSQVMSNLVAKGGISGLYRGFYLYPEILIVLFGSQLRSISPRKIDNELPITL